MTTLTHSAAGARSGLLPILGAAAFGIGLLFFAGFAQATVFHDAAHDTRHAIAFPCH
ncbi:CbtB domain-containing protein [Pseudoruegeria sp. SHC-113]|uniref:CbtB domain-containing protein n=1 Tax=Pseudoruegeria sp. SHC-113 TaxID=2855439 RepID=UPI0021BA9FBC|nr:CbtB domain-containing protein [Pseudoruegeria sp. SHC-113]MCT8159195.1 CbtB-domain containing protein [Pseudoruegeria sp. SHC-113]